MTAHTEYENRLEARQRSYDQLCRKDDHAVSFRTAVFLVGILVAWVVLGGWGVPWQFLLIPVGLFLGALFYHESVKRKQRSAKLAIDYYQRCLQRLDGKWSGIGPDGGEFLDPLHHYAGDLDIFGIGSLFQLLNSPITPSGAKTLANWLAPASDQGMPSGEAVINRQNAVRTLRDQLDLRERLAVIGPTKQSQLDARELQKWLKNPGGLTAPWIRVVGVLLGAAGISALGYWFFSGSPSALILVVFVQMGFFYRLREPLKAIKEHSEHAVIELHRIVQVIAELETVTGDDPEIDRLRSEWIENGTKASDTIHQLERTVSQFENTRRNVFIAPLAFISMAGMHYASAIDRWRNTHGRHVDRWFQAVGELEALLAFSQFHYENPTYCFPTLINEATRFIAKGLSHPLLPGVSAIANDVELSENCRLLLVSGSNMSGKSTLLRSVGINTVLSWAGAPVCARELELSRLQVAAAMRMQDSLQAGTSHFFAELKRIQLVVELAQRPAENEPTVLFLLDEILHGTNSHDRLVGARGVIESLLKTGALGLVTTHDLALSEIVKDLDTPSQNVHFRDEWINGKMTFDYQMREGVVPKSNALSLMRLLGLDV
ncbi:MAG: DNA mismatch repair protein MutS [Planctomycetes bacterium]|nr:DNA mismatch repair protein MutS [Planctomycetota bacterium]